MRQKNVKGLIEWCKNTNATKDKKWIYTLIAYVIEHADKPTYKLNIHINTILKHNQGYFKKYHGTKKEKDYFKTYYELHAEEYVKRAKKIDYKRDFVYNLYNQGALPELCTKFIQAKLEKKKLKLCGGRKT